MVSAVVAEVEAVAAQPLLIVYIMIQIHRNIYYSIMMKLYRIGKILQVKLIYQQSIIALTLLNVGPMARKLDWVILKYQ